MTSTATDLDARYGRRPRSRRGGVVAALAALLAVLAVAWVVWSGVLSPAQLEFKNTAHSIVDDGTTEVRFTLSLPPGSTAACAVQALNSSFGVVGWRVVEYPASPDRSRDLRERVRTTERAVTGLIYRCWLT